MLSTASGTRSLPMSCSSAPIASARSRPAGTPRRSPSCTASSATRRVCCSVEASFSARRTISARTCGPSSASSAATSSAAARSPVSGCDGASRRRSSATGMPIASMPSVSSTWLPHQPRLHGRPAHRGGQRERQPADADADREVGAAPGERERAPARAVRAARTGRATRASVAIAGPPPGSGWAGTRSGSIRPVAPSARIQATVTNCSRRSSPSAPGPRRRGCAARQRIAAPTGSVAPPAKASSPVLFLAEEHLRGRERMDQQQRRHRGERGADRDGANVAAPRSGAGQRDRGDAGDQHRDPDGDHVGHVEVVELV